MPTRVLLEGPAIEPLLAQVREEYGSAVRIISADKVRSGGFGGFFAKQRYELSVEVPDETPDQVVESPLTAARRRAAQQGAADDEAPTLEQLLARAESNDRITGHGGGRHADPSADGDDRDTASDEPAGGFSTDTTFAALMAGLDPANAGADRDRDRAPMVRPLRPAPDSSVAAKPMPSLAELMGGREAEDLAPPAAAPARPNGAGPAGGVATAPNPRLTRLQRTAAAYGQLPSSGPPANATAGTLAPADGAASGPDLGADPLDPSYAGPLDRDDSAQFGPDSTDPLGPGGTDPLGLTATHAGAPPAEVSQAEASQAEASQAEVSQAEASQAEASPAWAQPAWATRPAADPPAPEPATAHQALTGQVLADAAPPEDRAPARQAPTHTPQEQTPFGQVLADAAAPSLIRVGMPEALARTIKGADTYAGVLTALASLPPAPPVPDAPGEVLVLAGELAHAMPIARQIVDQIGVEQTHLLLAGSSAAGTGVHASRVISGPAEAEKRAEKMQSAEAPWVVVLDAPIGATDPTWVRETCQALGATAVWAVVDATRKTADTARHLATLGDVEALVVHGVELTSDPATVLGLDLPIVSFDGQPATPHAWAAMLCARIAADVAPVAAAPRRRRPARKEQ